MFEVRTIDSFDLPELQPYRTMRRQMDHRQRGIFVAEGEKVVRRLLESRFGLISVLLPEHWLAELEPLLRRRPEQIPVFVAPKRLLETLTGFSMYQGLLAVGKIPPPPSLAEIAPSAGNPLLVAAEGLSSAENLGVIARNCAAFGARGMIIGETCVSPFLRRAVRSSMGAVFEVPMFESSSLAGTLLELRRLGVALLAAHPQAKGRTLWQANFQQPCCIVFGSEGSGLTSDTLDRCDDIVAIPMTAAVDSLNVGSASAAFLCEAVRQRSLPTGPP